MGSNDGILAPLQGHGPRGDLPGHPIHDRDVAVGSESVISPVRQPARPAKR